ncbi:hypothetical protein ScalyP_jg7883 [Parmales sp. scaly parma]|nr:hypothetical protein ScalyP_jg7883 [Parmales sp. scaly parma]
MGDHHSHSSIAESLASLNNNVVRVDFRCGSSAPYSSKLAFQDLQDVVHHIQNSSPNTQLGVVGSSSGGFFALKLVRMLPPQTFAFCIPLCPVSQPGTRAKYLRSCMNDSPSSLSSQYPTFHTKEVAKAILDGQLSFFSLGIDEMDAAALPLKTPHPSHPPTLLILGSADKNVPFAVNEPLLCWVDKTIIIGGAGHEIQDAMPQLESHKCYIEEIAIFIKRLKEAPKLDEMGDVAKKEEKAAPTTDPFGGGGGQRHQEGFYGPRHGL